jgi:hypothetical protein
VVLSGSSTTTTGRHDYFDIAEILLKVALNTKNHSFIHSFLFDLFHTVIIRHVRFEKVTAKYKGTFQTPS